MSRVDSLIAGIVLLTLCALPALAQRRAAENLFGPNVLLLHPSDETGQMQARIDRIFAQQEHSEFGSGRYAILLAPGHYRLRIPVGFYTQVVGLGLEPGQVQLDGDLRAEASQPNNNATCNFWRGAEGFTIQPQSGTMQWAVSQATFLRRMHIEGDLTLHQRHGWASGGWLSDSTVDGTVDSGTQQQWISRNTAWGRWTGSNWNMVFVGANNAPQGTWPTPPFTRVERTPVIREKPYLVASGSTYRVVVPGLRRDTTGPTPRPERHADPTIPLSRFYIAHPERDTAASLNAQLRAGKHLLLTPGIYRLTAPLEIRRGHTVVLGLGFATLQPVSGTPAMNVADVDGVTVAGILFDAGSQRSPWLLRVGEPGSHRPHPASPIALYDVSFRVGGAGPASVVSNLIVDAANTLIDNTWIWRADHGEGVGWNLNPSENGITVNGDDVTVYGLFVEHHQGYQTLWNGERGRVYFYQSELPYDPPTQADWRSDPETHGYASYKVAPTVHLHQAWGLGVYSVFMKPNVSLDSAIEVPDTPGVQIHHAMDTALARLGFITHVINGSGETAHPDPQRNMPRIAEYPVPQPQPERNRSSRSMTPSAHPQLVPALPAIDCAPPSPRGTSHGSPRGQHMPETRSSLHWLRATLVLGLALLTLAAPHSVAGAQMPQPDDVPLHLVPYHAGGIYQVGETVGWTVTPKDAGDHTAYRYTILRNNQAVLASGKLDLTKGSAKIEIAGTEPEMLLVEVTPDKTSTAPSPLPPPRTLVGAAVSPTLLRPSVARPADFLDFWKGKLAELAKVPIAAKLYPVPVKKPGVNVSIVTLDSLHSQVHGYLAQPGRPGKFPAILIFQWAGVYKLNPEVAAGYAADGWLAFNVDAHNMEPDDDKAELNDYAKLGDADREQSYFLRMFLRDTRAIDYLSTLKQWDGKTIVVTGASMGGWQSLAVAGLNPGRVTQVIVLEPAGIDTNADLHGRKAGYPFWPSDDPAVMKTALYFDPVNFAPEIKASTSMAAGFIDTVAPPAGIYTAFNLIPAPKQFIPLVDSGHQDAHPAETQAAYYTRQNEALTSILKTGTLTLP